MRKSAILKDNLTSAGWLALHATWRASVTCTANKYSYLNIPRSF